MKIRDSVVLIVNLPETGLQKGQVGTIVDVLADSVYEVEFADLNGRTYAMLTLKAEQLLLLHYSPMNQAG